ncbi:MAG: hypothetical protein IT427_16280 [Pirellulales bacterium]|nr:hypothetical protein [Pirellulales bacterium]
MISRSRIVAMTCSALLLASWTFTAAAEDAAPANSDFSWPAITNECRPWTYWWWMGNAVDPQNLRREFARYRAGGLGGLHIVPIYGAKGAESRYIDYLSPRWMSLLDFAVRDAGRLDLGVDMTTGTGWCFGGPEVTRAEAGLAPALRRETLKAGETLKKQWPRPEIQAVMAFAKGEKAVDLLALADAFGSLQWSAGEKDWMIVSLEMRSAAVPVKRAAPGGEGLMLNPADAQAMRHYLERFTKAFDAYRGAKPRAMYHDSYEYRTSWTPNLLPQFEKRRGYRLQDHLAELTSNENPDRAARVASDYRETISDAMIEDVFPQWISWCQTRGIRTRNQAHGSPANILDLYALADIPETEIYKGGRDPLRSQFDEHFGEGRSPLPGKFASSAAHVAGRKLVAAETGTWLAEHFCETLEEMKCLADLMFLSGVNHVVYHGCCYSPDDAPWPGWLFYASTEMNPRNPLWRDVPALNAYIARCQAILQSGKPYNDVLLYWPIYDLWHTPREGRKDALTVIKCEVAYLEWIERTSFYRLASHLWKRGWSFDYVSDRQLAAAESVQKEIAMPGGRYRAVVVPPTNLMPPATMEKLVALAESGSAVVFVDKLPQDVPGLSNLEQRRAAFKELISRLKLEPVPDGGVMQARVGQGTILVGDLEKSMNALNILREEIVDHPGTQFIRRRLNEDSYYFIANQSIQPLDAWAPLASKADAVLVMDPMSGKIGRGSSRKRDDGLLEVHLRLDPGHSAILHALPRQLKGGNDFLERSPGPVALKLNGPWQVRFLEGGPEIPQSIETSALGSWTKNGDPRTESFAGTAVYRTTFDAPAAGSYWLDLGEVRHSARVRVNGRELGTLFMHPYRILAGELQSKGNSLEVEVTNLAANRIRDLDRRKISWRNFYNANVMSKQGKALDATDWPVFDSGLLGPVTLREDR